MMREQQTQSGPVVFQASEEKRSWPATFIDVNYVMFVDENGVATCVDHSYEGVGG